MRTRSRLLKAIGRLALLVGAIAFVFGAALEPLIHPVVEISSEVGGFVADDGSEPRPEDKRPIPHDEGSCVVCQLLGANALHMSALRPGAPSSAPYIISSLSGDRLVLRFPSALRSRAPPIG